jgi:hypothetical protein
MAKRPPTASVTKATLAAAVRRARDCEQGEIRDAACPGLVIRMRGGKVGWSIRARMGGKNRRWELGGSDVAPEEARRRAWKVKDCIKQGVDPGELIREWVTGIPSARQRLCRDRASIPWERARDLFLAQVSEKRRIATYDDYRKTLCNEPELAIFRGRSVSTIHDTDIAEVLAAVHKRTESGSEHLQRILSSMWTFLARPENRNLTSVIPRSIRDVRAPERTRQEVGDPDNPVKDEPPPDKIQLGRVVAIARLGVFSPALSDALLLLCGSFQRRRAVVGARLADFQSFDDEELWAMPPYFRKTARKRRSQSRHLVPLVGFAVEAVRRLDALAFGQPWLLPVTKTRRIGQTTKNPHIDPRTLSRTIEAMPGVTLSSHAFRRAAASYGPSDLGWHPDDSKLILDHLEGFDPGDTTAQFYNMDAAIVKKRQMMRAWVDWLEEQAAGAIRADPTLLDRDAVAEAVYRKRYGDGAWEAALKRSKEDKLPWFDAA